MDWSQETVVEPSGLAVSVNGHIIVDAGTIAIPDPNSRAILLPENPE